ncbi:MAG: TlpA family protein disulfide reductase [Myxococcales bacterium]|nr:TlpA family protein disulfide reductase [Myxococcales bacterium]MDH3483476.1 TlpA family protein disulfide reductase [Myxococcales bacterium]
MTGAQRPGWRKWLQWLAGVSVFFVVYSFATRARQLPLVGEAAPDVTLPVAAGGPGDGPLEVRLSALEGRVVVLDFWASWCNACRRTSPILNDLQEEFEAEDVSFYAINVEPIDRQRVQAAHLSFGNDFPTLHDRAGTAQKRYAVRTLPTVVVVGRDGIVKWARSGVPGRSDLRNAISGALN